MGRHGPARERCLSSSSSLRPRTGCLGASLCPLPPWVSEEISAQRECRGSSSCCFFSPPELAKGMQSCDVGVSQSHLRCLLRGDGKERGRKGEHQAPAQNRHVQPASLLCCCLRSLPRLWGQSFRGFYELMDLPKSALVLYLKTAGMFN